MPLRCRCRAQEDVKDHGEDKEDYVAHDAEPEAWVFEELFVVSAEEDVADGHAGQNPSKMSHERHLEREKEEGSEFAFKAGFK